MASRADSVRRPAAGARRRNRVIGVAGAVVAAIAVWAVGEPVLGHDLVIKQPGQDARDLGVSAVAVFALASSLLGWALLAVLERVTARAGLIWTLVAVFVLAASFLPLMGVETTAGTKAVLALMHAAVGVVLIPLFWRTVASDSRRPAASHE